MNSLEQGMLIASISIATSMMVSYFNEGKVNWKLAIGMAAGVLIGAIFMHYVRGN